ncbi:MAG: hypothetical protein P4K83_11205 [Terracidiphilus sp.]|nr:hypothetical protein [Terracidiphilus sp.]
MPETTQIPQTPSSELSNARTGDCPETDAELAALRAQMDAVLDKIAAELYNLASMLVGESEEGVKLVETAIDKAEISACQNPRAARKSIGRALCKGGVALLASRDAESLKAPETAIYPATCIEDDDLESAGISLQQLEQMFSGPDRDRVRNWLTQLPLAIHAVFVMRAVASLTPEETAGILAEFGGPQAAGWKPESVREVFRQGLCSLASQLIHASAGASAETSTGK